jgi:hypothetical protein
MTTPWKIEPDWLGETVAVLASGPSMTKDVAASLAAHKCIAVNYTFRLAPAAEMLVVLDANPVLWGDAEAFVGMRVCGVATDDIDALYAGPMYERITLDQGNQIETRNSGLAAIRIAAAMGATRIILAGFDPELPGYFDGHPAGGQAEGAEPYPGITAGLAAIVAELREKGIEVEFFEHAAVEVVEPAVETRRKGSKGA